MGGWDRFRVCFWRTDPEKELAFFKTCDSLTTTVFPTLHQSGYSVEIKEDPESSHRFSDGLHCGCDSNLSASIFQKMSASFIEFVS